MFPKAGLYKLFCSSSSPVIICCRPVWHAWYWWVLNKMDGRKTSFWQCIKWQTDRQTVCTNVRSERQRGWRVVLSITEVKMESHEHNNEQKNTTLNIKTNKCYTKYEQQNFGHVWLFKRNACMHFYQWSKKIQVKGEEGKFFKF